MTKTKLIGLGLALLGAVATAAYQTGVGTDVINAVCPDKKVVVPAPAPVEHSDAGL